MNEFHPYRNKTAVLTTIHGKQEVIAPIFQDTLGVSLIVPESVDTDVLGTFSGEIERQHSMLETLRLKVELGMNRLNSNLGVGTEASFGPDPFIPFAPLHLEMILWRDLERGIEVLEQVRTNDTNYEHLRFKRVTEFDEELESYLRRVQFPSHKLIVLPNARGGQNKIFKGIGDRVELQEAVKNCAGQSADGMALIQTDMRAMMNPTRLKVIGESAMRLANRLAHLCERCGCPGWGLVELVRGSPCDWCGRPTNQVWAEVHGCSSCAHRLKHVRKDGGQTASPAFCDWCNP